MREEHGNIAAYQQPMCWGSIPLCKQTADGRAHSHSRSPITTTLTPNLPKLNQLLSGPYYI